MVYGIEEGDLAKWLGVLRANGEPGAVRRDVPERYAEMLTTLRCAQIDGEGRLRITDKGLLALRMAAPNALHRQDDPDEV